MTDRLANYRPMALSVLRIVSGLLFLAHGTQKFLSFPGGEHAGGGWAFAHPGAYAGLIELVAGALIALGLFTRPAAILASGSMAYAYFVVHQPQALLPIQNGGVTPALYAWIFLTVAVLGAGPWSLDALIARRRGKAPAVTPERENALISAN